jgi:GNAT superfamily N-acetyltransferase
VRVADDYPTEFSVGVAQYVGAERQFGPFVLHRSEDEVVVGEIGGAFVDEEGTIEIGYAVVESHWNRGYATAAVEALVAQGARSVRGAPHRCPHAARAPTERPRAREGGLRSMREMDDADESGKPFPST